ncbi:MAG: hypothetical protein IKO06_01650, partial [Alphaproteobacteria bacterium]|nr:hypothetical protein [Alphaproteobacteria bacterium]
MRKFYIVMLLFVTTMALAQQKMTIKTSNGKTVEISCDGIMPTEIHVEGDKVIFKMNNLIKTETTDATKIDSIDTFALVEDSVTTSVESVDSLQNTPDSIKVNEFTGSSQSTIGFIADALVGEIVPEYNQITREHANDNPSSEKEVVKKFAKNFVSEDVVETSDFFGTIFKGLRFTKDSSFVAKYEQRKPKKSWRGYNIIELDGSFGQNIDQLSSSITDRISADDYGDDTKNEKKFGAGIKYSRVYMPGSELNGKWKPNPVGFAVSWGGLLSYSYEKDMGSYVSAMGKAGIQIGHDIAIGADALIGCGITPYNTFYTNGINFSMLNKSAFCFKYGVQLWGSLNFSKNTYTAIYGRYIRAAKPSSSFSDLPQDWEVVLEDFDPSSWSIGLAVGCKFGAPQELSRDKRLQAGITTGYQFIGKQKGALISA